MAEFGAGIPHYHGDSVRRLFVAAAALSLVAMPAGNVLPLGYALQLIMILVLVLLAGLTNRRSRTMLVLNAAVAAVSFLLIQAAAIYSFQESLLALSIIREIVSIIFIFAFFFSVKTLNSFSSGMIGVE